jgi:hypothetical protein
MWYVYTDPDHHCNQSCGPEYIFDCSGSTESQIRISAPVLAPASTPDILCINTLKTTFLTEVIGLKLLQIRKPLQKPMIFSIKFPRVCGK